MIEAFCFGVLCVLNVTCVHSVFKMLACVELLLMYNIEVPFHYSKGPLFFTMN